MHARIFFDADSFEHLIHWRHKTPGLLSEIRPVNPTSPDDVMSSRTKR